MKNNEYISEHSQTYNWITIFVCILLVLGIIGGTTAGIIIPKLNNQDSPTVESPSIDYVDDINYFVNGGYIAESLKDLPITYEFQINGHTRKKIQSGLPEIFEYHDSYKATIQLSDLFVNELLQGTEVDGYNRNHEMMLRIGNKTIPLMSPLYEYNGTYFVIDAEYAKCNAISFYFYTPSQITDEFLSTVTLESIDSLYLILNIRTY